MRWAILMVLALAGCAGFKPNPNYDPSADLAVMGALAPYAAHHYPAPVRTTNCYSAGASLNCTSY